MSVTITKICYPKQQLHRQMLVDSTYDWLCPWGGVKEDNVEERILVCRDPKKSRGEGRQTPNDYNYADADGSADGRQI